MRDTASAFARRLALVRQQTSGATSRLAIEPPPASPWMSTVDLAEYLRLTTRRRPLEAARDWARSHELVPVIRNRELLYARRDVEIALAADDERQARRTSSVRTRTHGRSGVARTHVPDSTRRPA